MNLPRLSPAAERLLSAAAGHSARLGHSWLGVEHLFLALATTDRREAMSRAFEAQDFEIGRFEESLCRGIEGNPDQATTDSPVYTRRGRHVMALAGRIADGQGEAFVEPAHILESIFREGRSVPVRLLRASGLDVAELHHSLTAAPPPTPKPTDTPLLARFGRDLTELARSGRLSPLIGREKELGLLAQILLRRNKNNPVLVGEAGVGKTAVVEGFAEHLDSPDGPAPLADRRVVELSVGALVAGTKYRGEFEERLLGIVEELTSHPEVIVFLDEIHTLVGAGAASGDGLDASNILKPALARGEIRCIGATTVEEYRRYVEKDPALERRFGKVLVDEPTSGETVEILSGLRATLEAHHRASIASEAIRAAVDLTVAHVPDRQLPDKALDALDQTCARRRLEEHGSDRAEPIRITEEQVVTTVAQWTGIPLEKITREASDQLLGLADELRSRVVGQDAAVEAVARAVVTARAGLAAPNRPVGVFFFLGPTGVGKTELARSLAESMFEDPKRLVRFDMSEFTEAHSVAKLIGAPPGYVGHDREGLLVSALRTRPHCVVLFDEIEKAHEQVFDLFLQIFDEGRLTGAHGRTADFTQAVVILTSNLEPVPPPARRRMGFADEAGGEEPPPARLTALELREALAGVLRPELVNRIDEIVLFRRLGRDHLRLIVDRYVHELQQRLAERDVTLTLHEAVYDRLLELGASDLFGARELRRVVDRHLRQPLARAMLGRDEQPGEIRVSVEHGELVMR